MILARNSRTFPIANYIYYIAKLIESGQPAEEVVCSPPSSTIISTSVYKPGSFIKFFEYDDVHIGTMHVLS